MEEFSAFLNEDELKPIKIKIKKKNTPKIRNSEIKNKLEDHVQVYPENLKYLYGTWIKCVCKTISEQSMLPGGFLSSIDLIQKKVYLRHPKILELSEIDMHTHSFYVNKNNENYKALKEIEIEKQKLENDKKILHKQKIITRKQMESLSRFEREKNKFEDIRRRFYRQVTDGKIIIL
ncbi:MAG TPA: hypothetical protein V6C58_26655 [Allocoleopsis sp.]